MAVEALQYLQDWGVLCAKTNRPEEAQQAFATCVAGRTEEALEIYTRLVPL